MCMYCDLPSETVYPVMSWAYPLGGLCVDTKRSVSGVSVFAAWLDREGCVVVLLIGSGAL